jgi:FkbM family methyltransferase
MNDRTTPKLIGLSPQDTFESFMNWGAKSLPPYLANICFRKLKRRYRLRNEGAFEAVLADLKEGDLCLDLGANLGEITNHMADAGAKVISFEPDPDIFEILKRNTEHQANVTLHCQATGIANETLSLRRAARFDEDAQRFSQCSSLIRNDKKMAAENSVDVQVIDFIAFLNDLDRDVRILKIDIEGSECAILQELVKHPVVQRIDTIFVETHEWMNPKDYIPITFELLEWAKQPNRPYVNLFWG